MPTNSCLLSERFVSKICVIWIFALISVYTSQNDIVENEYLVQFICDINNRWDLGCLSKVPETRSVLDCVTHCNIDNTCVGASLNSTVCFKHRHCPGLVGCTTKDTNLFYISKKCAHGGTYIPSTGSCQCVDAWVGPTCLERPKDCQELITYGYAQGFYKTFLDPDSNGKNLLHLYCSIIPSSGYDIAVILSQEGNVDLNLTWNGFRNGVFFDDNNFWMGLESWHILSSAGYNTFFIIIDFGDHGTLYRIHRKFQLFGEDENYAFTFKKNYDNGRGPMASTGNKVMDCLGPVINTPFSTWDRDNDQAGNTNCAARAGTGWWYQECNNTCNLFGWGADYRDSKPNYQILAVPGIDIDSVLDKVAKVVLYIQK